MLKFPFFNEVSFHLSLLHAQHQWHISACCIPGHHYEELVIWVGKSSTISSLLVDDIPKTVKFCAALICCSAGDKHGR